MNPIGALVSSMTRAVRALGYYDASHPVFIQAQNEALASFQRVRRGKEPITLAGAASKLFIDADGETLDDGPAALLARRMFKSSILAIRIRPTARAEDFGYLVRVLAESADRLRDAGGAHAVFELSGGKEIDLYDVDFGAVFAGDHPDLSPLTRGDAVAELALYEVLRVKADEDAEGEALGISFQSLGSVESLGSFLDELLDKDLSGDETADLAARAYLTNHDRMTRGGATAPDLSNSARVLSERLVKLSPEARFALLRRLAAGEQADAPEQRAAVAELAPHVDGKTIVTSVVAALLDQGRDAETVRAIGDLLRRLRPVEADRRKLLEVIDREMTRRERPLDGVLWQEMQSRALEDSALGMLELDLAERKAELVARTKSRMSGRLHPVAGESILRARGRKLGERHTSRALAGVLLETRTPQEALLTAIKQLLESSNEPEVNSTLLSTLLRQAEADATGAVGGLVRTLLEGERGAERTRMLAAGDEQPQTRVMGEVLLRALEVETDRQQKEQLLDRLAAFDHEILKELGTKVAEAEPQRAHNLLRVAMRADRKLGIKFVRIALRNQSLRAKDHAVRALAEAPDGEGLGLLAMIAGWKGEKTSRAALHFPPNNELEKKLFELQLAAIGTLGWSKSPLAVEPLKDFLLKTKLLANKHDEDCRVAAAQALVVNNTPQARAALEEGLASKKKNIHDLCVRALESSRRDQSAKKR